MKEAEKPKTSIRSEVEAEYSTLLATFRVAAKILAVRLFLFLSLAGSFALAVIANETQSNVSCAVLLLYACVTTLPLTVIELKNKRG